MAAIVGAAGLRSTLAAARAGKRVMIANGKPWSWPAQVLLRRCPLPAPALPIDSEHNAVFQCLPRICTPGSGSGSAPHHADCLRRPVQERAQRCRR